MLAEQVVQLMLTYGSGVGGPLVTFVTQVAGLLAVRRLLAMDSLQSGGPVQVLEL